MMEMKLAGRVPEFAKFGQIMDSKKEKFFAAAMRIIVKSIIAGINSGVDITGDRFPALEPSTIAMKGHDKPLINKGLLTQEYTYEMINEWRIGLGRIFVKSITASGDTTMDVSTRKKKYGKRGSTRDTPRDEVAAQLQITGIQSRSGVKYFRFFGISKDAEEQVIQEFQHLVEEALSEL